MTALNVRLNVICIPQLYPTILVDRLFGRSFESPLPAAQSLLREPHHNFATGLELLKSKADYLFRHDPVVKGNVEALNNFLLHHIPALSCNTDLRHLRSSFVSLSCVDTRCKTGLACLYRGSIIIGGILDPLVTLYALARRILNAITRGYLRGLYEIRHSPNYSFEITAPFENLPGASLLDTNVMMHPSSRELSSTGITATLFSSIHPILPSPGNSLRLLYAEYCTQMNLIYYVLVAFNVNVAFVPATGSLTIKLDRNNPEQIKQLLHYAVSLLRESAFMAGCQAVKVSQMVPSRIPLPANLLPHGAQNRLDRVPSRDAVRALAEHLDFQLAQPANNLFGPESPIMTQSQELRRLLGERNPFSMGVSPHDSSAWLADISEDLHNENGRFSAYRDLIYPNGLIYRPEDGCRIPFCKRQDCPGERAGWDLLQQHLLQYREEEDQPARMLKYCHANPTISFKSDEMRVIETVRVYGLYTNPGGRSRAIWTVGQTLPMTWFIPEHQYTICLSASLPTRFSKKYLSVRPDDVPIIGERFMREGHRMRRNNRP
ncbi:unnamed protein product [Oikopleura dioica]|uniref:Uncharacterized protein n=1 Tax=Oikopleura dioica TaxID=34765 RepID=E4X4E7_OIKDI|nr:unnamed protein product [Oikopleura dioica]